MTGQQMIKVSFPTPDGPFGSESMWVEQTGPAHGRVANIPFFAYGVNHGDTISFIDDPDGGRSFEDVAARGATDTFRAMVADGHDLADVVEDLRARIGDAREVGVEGGFGVVLAVSAPSALAGEVMTALEALADAQVLTGWEGPTGETLAA